MGYSKRTYEAVAERLAKWVDKMSDALVERLGVEPPFMERKGPAERWQEYHELLRAGRLTDWVASLPPEERGAAEQDILRLARRFWLAEEGL